MNQMVRGARVSPLVFTFLTFIAIVAILYSHDISWASSRTQKTPVSPVKLEQKNEDVQEAVLPFAVGKTPEECDIFSGRWVRDNKSKPMYQESECPYLMPQVTCEEHGHPNKDYQSWSWQPYGCDLPK